MQYANILIKQKLYQLSELTYLIPTELLYKIKIGMIVEVPFRDKKIAGMVIKLIKKSPDNITLLPINRTYSEESVVTKSHLILFNAVAENTLSSLNNVVFYFLPPIIKNIQASFIQNQLQTSGNLKVISGNLRERFIKYLNIIDNFDGSILFIFPDYITLNFFEPLITNTKYCKVVGNDTSKNRWKMWYHSQSQKIIILSTRLGIGLVPKKPFLIIVDDPDHPGFREDRAPKLRILEIIKLRYNLGEQIVIGTTIPSLLLYHLMGLNIGSINIPKTLINYSSESLTQILSEEIRKNKRILIIVPQKNHYNLILCQDCRQILLCPNCSKTLTLLNSTKIICSKCNYNIDGFPECQKCHGNKFITFSIGTKGIYKLLTNLFSSNKIIVIDKSMPIPEIKILNKFEIIIATHQILDVPIKRVDLVICLGFDYLLDIPGFDQDEKIFGLIAKFGLLGNKLEIITHRPDHRIYHNLAQNNLEQFYQKLLSERQVSFPPFCRFVNVESNKKPLPKQIVLLESISQISFNFKYFENWVTTISVKRKDWQRLITIIDILPNSWHFYPEPNKIYLSNF